MPTGIAEVLHENGSHGSQQVGPMQRPTKRYTGSKNETRAKQTEYYSTAFLLHRLVPRFAYYHNCLLTWTDMRPMILQSKPVKCLEKMTYLESNYLSTVIQLRLPSGIYYEKNKTNDVSCHGMSFNAV